MRPLLILETGRPVPSLRRQGDFTHWIRVAAGLPAQAVQVCRVSSGEPLPTAGRHAGVVITGSGAMVTDREGWSERSAEWLRAAAARGTPLLGICYGHQLLADALGGEVADNPRGREIGTVPVDLHADAARDPLFAGLPNRFHAHTTHRQTVLRAPADAVVLAHSALDDCQAFRWGRHVWGLQFHPEFSVMHMRGYIRARRHALDAESIDPAQCLRDVRPAPMARRVLRRFVRHAAHAA